MPWFIAVSAILATVVLCVLSYRSERRAITLRADFLRRVMYCRALRRDSRSKAHPKPDPFRAYADSIIDHPAWLFKRTISLETPAPLDENAGIPTGT
jgi:hypothetical protein